MTAVETPERDDPADVLVIGAGPAGSAAAIELAKGGARVLLVDRCDFPRDKVCGDALIPDAVNALDSLSLKESVLRGARLLHRIRVYAPNQRAITIPGECACLPRQALDEAIRREAVRRGAHFCPGLTLRASIVTEGVVQGATFAAPDGRLLTIRATSTILATGAAAEPLKLFNVCQRSAPSATGARLYFEADEEFSRAFDYLCISYDRTIVPGYGWIFPGPNRIFNVGVGYYYDAKAKPPATNVRTLLERFLTSFPPAVELRRRSRQLTSLRGAPLRTALTGARLAVPGLLVVGEAAGLTYSLTGEGIGKAMESGMMAADVILRHLSRERTAVEAMARDYSARVRSTFATRFKAYKVAQDWLSGPTVANLLAWRASRSRFVRQQIAGVFQETVDPRQLFSASNLLRSLIS